jgi:hypothetical protein
MSPWNQRPRHNPMARLIIFGATGSLGRHVLSQALDAGHQVTVLVRTPAKLPLESGPHVSIHTGDLNALAPADLAGLISGHDALINCAGHVTEGEGFVPGAVAVENVAAHQQGVP